MQGSRAVGTGRTETVPGQLLLRSVGYHGARIDPELPFDAARGVVPTTDGGRVAPGLYAAGWIKRGPTGILGTNIPDARETVDVIAKDLAAAAPVAPHGKDLVRLLADKHVRVVDWAAAQRIDAAEVARAAGTGRPRIKFERVSEMLTAAAT